MHTDSAAAAREESTLWARANSPEARRELIRRLVDAAPPISSEQAAELGRLADAARQLDSAARLTATA